MFRISKRVLFYFSLTLMSGTALAQGVKSDIDGDGGVSAFYRWDGAIAQPGLPLREETFPATLSRPKLAGKAVRFLYTATSGVDRGTVPVSGLIYLPDGTPPKGVAGAGLGARHHRFRRCLRAVVAGPAGARRRLSATLDGGRVRHRRHRL